MELHKRVLRLIQSHNLIASGANVVVGVSGGADSLALLHILKRIQDEIACNLHVATLDHGLRGDAGAGDAQFVVDTAQSWGLSVTRERVNVPALAQAWNQGIEAAARRVRYEFLARVAHEQGARFIAVAHNADDQAETVFIHLLRGSGLDGLAGMRYSAPTQVEPSLTLIRPLLNIKRVEIDAYCAENDLKPRQDATNTDTSYLRNRIRHDIFPVLKEINPQFDRALVQLAEIVRAESAALDALLKKRIDGATIITSERVSLTLTVFLALDTALKRRFLRWAFDHLNDADKTAEINFQHIENALAIMERGETGNRAVLAGGFQVRRGYRQIFVETIDAPIESDAPLLAESEIVDVTVPGVTPFGDGWELVVQHERSYQEGVYLFVPSNGRVQLRARQSGDVFAPNRISQSLKNWLINNKVPSELRSRVPLIVVNDTVVSVIWGRLWRKGSLPNLNYEPQRNFHFSVRRNTPI